MKVLINLVLLFGLMLILLAAGFRLGVDFVQNFDITTQIVNRECVFYQNKYKDNLALLICQDGTWWYANPYFQIWDNPL